MIRYARIGRFSFYANSGICPKFRFRFCVESKSGDSCIGFAKLFDIVLFGHLIGIRFRYKNGRDFNFR